MILAKLEALVDDDFEPGCCCECPFSYYDENNLGDVFCILGCRYDECLIELKEVEDDN